MKVGVVGGSGKVGRIIVPKLLEDHDVTVIDLARPAYSGAHYVPMDISDVAAWEHLPSLDALVFLAMPPLGAADDVAMAAAQFDVSVRSLYLALNWAGRTGVSRIIYASSLTVFATPPGGLYPPNDARPDSHRAYGLAKWLGEEVCRAASTEWGMTVTALRLAHPSTAEEWSRPVFPTATSPDDVTTAFLAALEREAGDYIVVPISGDTTAEYVDVSPAREHLGWIPKEKCEMKKPWPVAR